MGLKLRLVCIASIFFSFIINAQVPPPPCGLTPEYICDTDEDGTIQVDLTQLYPFRFCFTPPENEEFYHPITYYFSEEDAEAEINPILNPETFSTSVVEQSIYRRANPIDPDNYFRLIAYDPLVINLPPTPATPSPLVMCDMNNNGFTVFDLNSKRQEILSGQQNYTVRFYETFDDANSDNNPISSMYSNTVAYQQTIFARVANFTGFEEYRCISIVELELIVQTHCEDLQVSLINPFDPPRPGFNFKHELIFENIGSDMISSGTINYIVDSDIDFINAFSDEVSDVITVTEDGFTLTFTNLDVGESTSVIINLSCPASVPLGELITSSASYTTNSNDINPNNDVSTINEIVIGAYDPNDKMESQGREIIIDNFTDQDYLYYTIRFQNLGTASAVDVRIEDSLNDQLDESTFQSLHLSHSGFVSRSGNQLVWNFENIDLPSEQSNPEGSRGFVYFKIKPKTGYSIGDIIPNSAAIYFDFNAPVITNTFETEFIEDPTLSIDNLNPELFNMFPNPARKELTIQLNSNSFGNVTVQLFDLQGKLIISDLISEDNTKVMDVSGLHNGLYIVKLSINNKTLIKKLVIE